MKTTMKNDSLILDSTVHCFCKIYTSSPSQVPLVSLHLVSALSGASTYHSSHNVPEFRVLLCEPLEKQQC